MIISVTFDGFEEMTDFAARLLGQAGEKPVETAARTLPAAAAPSVPVAPAEAPSVPVVQAAAAVAPATPAVTAVPAVPTSAPEYTMDDLARAAIPLMDAGNQQALVGLLAQFGVSALTELKKEQYGAFATALRGLGAKI